MSEPTTIQLTTVIIAVFSSLAAILSGWCAYLSFKLSSKLRNEMKSDERLIISNITHPALNCNDHTKCIIRCNIFNKSKRKSFVNGVKAYNSNNEIMDITWSNHIDNVGEPDNPCGLIGIVDTEELFVRKNGGEEIDFCKLEIFHSFSSSPITAIFDPVGEAMAYRALHT